MNFTFLRKSPEGILRLLLRLPTYLYRARLGWLVGHRFLMLTHQGRKSGLPRQAVLEVLRYNPRTKESVVLAAWGDKSDWFRNIQAHPALKVQTGFTHYVPQQHILTPEEGRALYAKWERSHPIEARIAPAILASDFEGTPAEKRAHVAWLPMVAFRPKPLL